jgi:DNA transformation protein
MSQVRGEGQLGQLKNIGATIEARLREVGVRTAAELRRLGAIGAYRRIQAAYPEKRLPVCFYLYSLEGALRGVHWDSLPASVKAELLAAIEAGGRVPRRRKGGPRPAGRGRD